MFFIHIYFYNKGSSVLDLKETSENLNAPDHQGASYTNFLHILPSLKTSKECTASQCYTVKLGYSGNLSSRHFCLEVNTQRDITPYSCLDNPQMWAVLPRTV